MKLFGLQTSTYYMSWFTTHFSILFISSILITAVGIYPFSYSNFVVLFVFYQIAGIAFIAYAYTVASFFSSSKIAGEKPTRQYKKETKRAKKELLVKWLENVHVSWFWECTYLLWLHRNDFCVHFRPHFSARICHADRATEWGTRSASLMPVTTIGSDKLGVDFIATRNGESRNYLGHAPRWNYRAVSIYGNAVYYNACGWHWDIFFPRLVSGPGRTRNLLNICINVTKVNYSRHHHKLIQSSRCCRFCHQHMGKESLSTSFFSRRRTESHYQASVLVTVIRRLWQMKAPLIAMALSIDRVRQYQFKTCARISALLQASKKQSQTWTLMSKAAASQLSSVTSKSLYKAPLFIFRGTGGEGQLFPRDQWCPYALHNETKDFPSVFSL